MRLTKSLLSIIISCFLFSCGGEVSEKYKTISKNELGDFRGVKLGMSKSQVKKNEEAQFLKDEMPAYLHYDVPINMGNSFTIAYDFSPNNELYEIEISVFLDVIEDAQKLFEEFNEKFTKKYGKSPELEDGFTIWKDTLSSRKVEIAMKNDSDAYGYLSIIIRDLDY